MSEAIMVGMSEIKLTCRKGDVLTALGLGSCIGICAYDARVGTIGLAHVVLPESGGDTSTPGKFADTAVPKLLEEMQREGADPRSLRIAIVGGAQLFAGVGTGAKLDIGPRNAAAVQMALQNHQFAICAHDLGGNAGRTVYLYADGRIRIKTMGQGERDWISLACPPTQATLPQITPPWAGRTLQGY